MNMQTPKSNMPVLLPAKIKSENLFDLRLKPWHGLFLLGICVFTSTVGIAASGPIKVSVIETLFRWMPLLLKAFMFNILISVLAMGIGTAVGTALGLGQISPNVTLRRFCWFITQFFRNSPWLVLLFFAMFLLPFKIQIGPLDIPLPDWLKATIGLSLPVMANVSEIVRGAVNSLPSGQWEAAESLAYSRRQTLWLIILPQCVKRMLPPWMNLYSILTMATVLASIVGVSEVMTTTGQALASEGGRSELLAPFYSFILLIFFMYCYPIARWTVHLEKKFAVKG
ncbi:MAG: amino acid ABC transporter permease [Rhizobiaceae bacterium]|nr:amino acid ABC transporter permease [Rhizobiaceae bacterium]